MNCICGQIPNDGDYIGPAWRYNPRLARPTNPNCQQHGGTE